MSVQRQAYCFDFIVNIYELILYKDVNYKLIFMSKDWILMFVLGILLYVHIHIHIYVKFFIYSCMYDDYMTDCELYYYEFSIFYICKC